MKPKNIRKSQSLCHSIWHTSNIYERRVLAVILSQIQPDDKYFRKYMVRFSDITKHCGQRAYQQLKDDLEYILPKSKIIIDGVEYSLFSEVVGFFKKNMVRIALNEQLKSYFLNLRMKDYVEYDYNEFFSLTSMYAQILYEYLKSVEGYRNSKVNLEKFYEFLSVPENYRYVFADFRRKILEPALKQINDRTSLNYSFRRVKKNNKVVEIIFINENIRQERVSVSLPLAA